MRYPLEGERYLLEKELPELGDARPRTPGASTRPGGSPTSSSASSSRSPRGADPGHRRRRAGRHPGVARRLGIAAMAAKIYPEARRALIARGRPEAEVEAMPVVQVAALYTLQEYQRLLDEHVQVDEPPLLAVLRPARPGGHRGRRGEARQPAPGDVPVADARPSTRPGWRRSGSTASSTPCSASRRSACTPPPTGASCPRAWRRSPRPRCRSTPRPGSRSPTRSTATRPPSRPPYPPGAPNHPSYTIRYALKLAR